MKPITILGAVLIVAGVVGLLLGHFSYSQTTPVLKAGPLQINSQEDHTVWIPTAAGIVVVLGRSGTGRWLTAVLLKWSCGRK